MKEIKIAANVQFDSGKTLDNEFHNHYNTLDEKNKNEHFDKAISQFGIDHRYH